MKLNELNKKILWEGDIEGEQYMFYLEEGYGKFVQNKKGGLVSKAFGLVKSNPVLAGLAAGYAVNALNKYQKNKRMTTRFFAKSPEEKKLYKQIVADLMKTGRYKKVKEKYVDGGIMYELKRTG